MALNHRVKSLLSGYKTTCPCLESNCLCIPGQGTPRDLSEDGFLWCWVKKGYCLYRIDQPAYVVRARSSGVLAFHVGSLSLLCTLDWANQTCSVALTKLALCWGDGFGTKGTDWRLPSVANVCRLVVRLAVTFHHKRMRGSGCVWYYMDLGFPGWKLSTCAVLAFRDPSLCQTFVKPSRCR